MALRAEIKAVISAMTATNSSVQVIAASSGYKLVGINITNASTNTAVAFVNHGTSHAVGTVISGARLTAGQGERNTWEIPGSGQDMGLNVESGVFLRRIAGQPIVTLFYRKY